MKAAAAKGDLDTIKRLRSEGCLWDTNVYDRNLHLSRFTQRLTPSTISIDYNCPSDEDKTCTHAAANGHLDVLKWVRSQDPPCPWDEKTCLFAAFNGHLEVLKWLRNQSSNEDSYRPPDELKRLRAQPPPDGKDPYGRPDGKDAYGRPCPWDEKTCLYAAFNGHLHILTWALEHGCPWPEGNDLCFTINAENMQYYDAVWWLFRHRVAYIGSAELYVWVNAIDEQANQLPLPSDLIRLIKQFI